MHIKLVVLYARVSKPDKTNKKESNQDPENQLCDLRALAKLKGWKIVREYVDHASGATESRPQFDRMMRDLTKGLIDAQAMLVWKIDRLGRSVKHLFNIIDELRTAEVAFVSWSDNIDLSTPTGELIFGVLASVAQFELSLIRERTKAGLRKAVAEGKILGRPISASGPSASTLWRRARAASAK
jgi:DNA invertase Pin-like site-specific DNA recombinase